MAERVKDLCYELGLSCEGHEEEMWVLFSDIEAKRVGKREEPVIDVSAKPGFRGNCKLKQLECSVNYNGKGGQSSRMDNHLGWPEKVGMVNVFYESKNNHMECVRDE